MHPFTGVVCTALQLTVLIIDSQSSGKGRFVAVGPPAADPTSAQHYILLHRTRREHFNYVTISSKALFGHVDLPHSVTSAWNLGGGGKREGGKDAGGGVDTGGEKVGFAGEEEPSSKSVCAPAEKAKSVPPTAPARSSKSLAQATPDRREGEKGGGRIRVRRQTRGGGDEGGQPGHSSETKGKAPCAPPRKNCQPLNPVSAGGATGGREAGGKGGGGVAVQSQNSDTLQTAAEMPVRNACRGAGGQIKARKRARQEEFEGGKSAEESEAK